MTFKTTQNCIQDILRMIGTASVDQLMKFFRNAPDASNVRYYIEEMRKLSLLDYEPSSNWVRYRDAPGLNDDVERRRVLAFWIVAEFGYDFIREIIPLRYPSQLLFITETDDVYDVTVCVSEKEAQLVANTRPIYTLPDVEDDVNHIALVIRPEVGEKVLKYGFDSYCVLDSETKEPHYTARFEDEDEAADEY